MQGSRKRFPYGSIHTFCQPFCIGLKKKCVRPVRCQQKRQIYNIIVVIIRRCHVKAKLLYVTDVRKRKNDILYMALIHHISVDTAVSSGHNA